MYHPTMCKMYRTVLDKLMDINSARMFVINSTFIIHTHEHLLFLSSRPRNDINVSTTYFGPGSFFPEDLVMCSIYYANENSEEINLADVSLCVCNY